MASKSDLSRVGRAIAARRGQLGMTQQDLADAGGVDLKTVYNLESGGRWPIAKTRAAVSAALRWEGDALATIRAGGIPAEVVPGEESTPPRSQPAADPAESRDPSLRPYIMWVRRDLDLARARHGPGFTGKDAFDPASEPWAVAIWDAHAFTEAQKIDTIARMRSEVDDAARTGGAAGNGGLTGSDCNHSDTSGSPILNLSH